MVAKCGLLYFESEEIGRLIFSIYFERVESGEIGTLLF